MTQDEDNPETRPTVAIDRRAYKRLPPTTHFVIVRTVSGEMTAAQVVDESIGGIGLWLEFRVGIEQLDTVQIVYTKTVAQAIVRRIEVTETQDGERIFAGLEWATPKPE